ncbi:hypothetical protein CBR_g12005 [Chara braunii]|uniref:U1-type domain-containing protein n=1 Tax=Chara braunii TaxID=69332 RepID=A0A388KQW0_CHABU|nr:hypothetical protein CBR_g12005 [Chara braunii]|eukprot:GBG72426.1 hypothetical protein CBR_g12005 [Chara braunii]
MATYQYADGAGGYHTLVSGGGYYDPYGTVGGGGGVAVAVDQSYVQTSAGVQLMAPSSGVAEQAAAAAAVQSAAAAAVAQSAGVAAAAQSAGGGHLETLYGLPTLQGVYTVESVAAAPAVAAAGGGTTGSMQMISTNPAATWGVSGGYEMEVATSTAQMYGNIPSSYQSSSVTTAGGTPQLAGVGGGYVQGAVGMQPSSGGLTRGGPVGSGTAGYGSAGAGGGTSSGAFGMGTGAVSVSGSSYGGATGRSTTGYGAAGGLGYGTATGAAGGIGSDGYGGSSAFTYAGVGRTQGQASQQHLPQALPQVLLPTTAAPSQQQLQNQMQPLQQQQQQATQQQAQQHMQQAQSYSQQQQQYPQQQQVQQIQQQVQMQQQVQLQQQQQQQQGSGVGGSIVRLSNAIVPQHSGVGAVHQGGHHHVQPTGTMTSSSRGVAGVGSSRGGMESRSQTTRQLAPLPTPDRRLGVVHPSSGGVSASLQQGPGLQQHQQQQQQHHHHQQQQHAPMTYYHYHRYGGGNPGVGNGVGGLGMVGGAVGAAYSTGPGSGQVVRMDPRIPMVGSGGGGRPPVGPMYGSSGGGMGTAANVMNRQQVGAWYRPSSHRMMGPGGGGGGGGGGGAPPVGAGRGYPSAPMFGRPAAQSSASPGLKGGNFPPPSSSGGGKSKKKKAKKSQGPTSRLCRVCNVECNSFDGLREHMKGRKHTRMVEKQAKELTASKVMEKVAEQEKEGMEKAGGALGGDPERLEENGVVTAEAGGGERVAANGGAGADGERMGRQAEGEIKREEGDGVDGGNHQEMKGQVEGEAAMAWKIGDKESGFDSEEEGSDGDEAPRRRRRRLERANELEMTGGDDAQRLGMKRPREGEEEGRDGDGGLRRGRGKKMRGAPGVGDKPKDEKPKVEGEMSEGWCDVCQVDCQRKKVLDLHVQGKKHLSKLRQAVPGPRWERWGGRGRGMGMPREMNTDQKEKLSNETGEQFAGGGRGGESNMDNSEPCVTLEGGAEPSLAIDVGADPCVTVEGAEPCVTVEGAEPCVVIQGLETSLAGTDEAGVKVRKENTEHGTPTCRVVERGFTSKGADEGGLPGSFKEERKESHEEFSAPTARGNGIEQQQDRNVDSARAYAAVEVKKEA